MLRKKCQMLNSRKADSRSAGFQTYRCDISKHLSLKCSLDVSTVSLFLLHYVFPVRVWHNKASLQHRQLSWRRLKSEITERRPHFRDRKSSSWWLGMTGEDTGLFPNLSNSGKSSDIPGKQKKICKTWQLTPFLKVKPWSYPPRPQLYATSLHQILKVWHWPTSSMRWRAAGIMSFSFPKKKKTQWKGVVKQLNKKWVS